MSLFIGNISRDTPFGELEDIFRDIGKCRVSRREDSNFCFVDYDREKDAEEALDVL